MSAASKMNKRLMLQVQGLNDDVGQWGDVGGFWGEVTPLAVRVRKDAVTHKIIARYQQAFAITAGQRIVYEGRYFMIRRVADMFENKKWLSIEAEEIGWLN